MDLSPAIPAPLVTLTPAGAIALLASLLSTGFGLILLSGPIFAIGALALFFLALVRRAAQRHLRGIIISRELPLRGRAGESFPVATHILPGAACPAGIFIHFRDPLFSTAGTAGEKRISVAASGTPSLLRYTGKSNRRGIVHPRFWTLRSAWPLGLFSTVQRGSFSDSATLLLHPKPFLPQRLRAHLEQLVREALTYSTAPPDPASDFRLLREFRPGDAVKRIHWPASLRSGQLQVAEFEPPRPKPRRYGILLHAYEPAGQVLTPETFEMTLRLAAGLLQRFHLEEIPVIFRHYPDRAAFLIHRRDVEDALDQLALSPRRPVATLEPLIRAARDFPACDEVFVLSDCPREEWENILGEHFPAHTCIDASSFTIQSKPRLNTSLRLPA